MYERHNQSDIPREWFEQKQIISGLVVSNPEHSNDKTRYRIRAYNDGTLLRGKILVSQTRDASIEYGDRVLFIAMAKKPEPFITDTGRWFHYDKYLEVKNVFAIASLYQPASVQGTQSSFVRNLLHVRNIFLNQITKMFSLQQAALLAGILIGEQKLFDDETKYFFQMASLTHIMVLSGYNITLVIMVALRMMGYFFGYHHRRIGAMIMIVFFLIMTGMGTSSVRAGVMGIFLLLLHITTRPVYHFRILMYTALIMFFVNPRMILYDPSFHLSFLAFVGLVYVSPLLGRVFMVTEDSFFLVRIINETMAVQLFVLPYMLWMSGAGSWLSLVSNIITVPIIPFIMGFGFIAVVLGMVWHPLSLIIATLLGIMLDYVLVVAKITAGIPWAQYRVPAINQWWVMVFYSTVSVFLIIYYRYVSFIKKAENEPNHSI